LGVSPRASQKEVTQAYRKLAARYHPDKHQGNELEELAREKLAQLNEAHDILSDPNKRAAYDAERRGQSWSPSSPPPTAGGPPNMPPRPLTSLLRTLIILGCTFLAFRFVRSPRALAVIGVALALAWFGPRVYRWFRRKK